MKNFKLYILLILLLSSCFEDKGNYEYTPIESYNISGIPDNIVVIADIESIKANISLVDSNNNKLEDLNYRFSVLLGVNNGSKQLWTELNPDGDSKLDTIAKFSPKNYKIWTQVFDKSSGVRVASKITKLTVTSSTYEGWLILCDEGNNNRCRVDMISIISDERQEIAYDIMTNKGLPESNNAYGFGYMSSIFGTGSGDRDKIYILCENETYSLNNETLETDTESTINNTDYLIPSSKHRPIVYYNVGAATGDFNIIITKEGDAYVQELGSAGAIFENKVNIDSKTGETYKVSPYVGYSLSRPYGGGKISMFFDIVNERFLGLTNRNTSQLIPLITPVNSKFDYNIKKELLYMASTSFNGGTAYAVLREDNKRFICGIDVSTSEPQQTYYSEIISDNISKANLFAFHSQFTFMYYSVDNRIYSYDLQQKKENLVVELPVGEKISLMKFNIYNNDYTKNTKVPDSFLHIQYQLIVGSYNSDLIKGGKVMFYDVLNENNTLKKVSKFTGFAKVKDIFYRERPKRF